MVGGGGGKKEPPEEEEGVWGGGGGLKIGQGLEDNTQYCGDSKIQAKVTKVSH